MNKENGVPTVINMNGFIDEWKLIDIWKAVRNELPPDNLKGDKYFHEWVNVLDQYADLPYPEPDLLKLAVRTSEIYKAMLKPHTTVTVKPNE